MPVPTEHVLDVMRWVLFRGEAVDAEVFGDPMRVVGLLKEADDDVRTLVGLVANATLRNEPLRLLDLADELGRTHPDVAATIEALNEHALEGERPLLELRNETSVGVHGQTGTIAHVSMRSDLALVARRTLRGEAPR
ncbi:MAG: hypothetical protein ABIX10_15030 [Acidimicrobiales bacterium]